MLFLVLCVDKPGRQDMRLANREAHLEFLKALGKRVVIGGPILSEDGTAMTGSALVIEADDRAAIEALLATEPYARAGLFESVVIRPFRKVFG